MLRFVGARYLILGLLALVIIGIPSLMSMPVAAVSAGIGVLVGALSVPALLFALADMVQHARGTRDAVRALAGISAGPAVQAAEASVAWDDAVDTETAAREARARARARHDAGSVGDGSRQR